MPAARRSISSSWAHTDGLACRSCSSAASRNGWCARPLARFLPSGIRNTSSYYPTPQKGETTMILLQKILVATDFSEASEAALAYGRQLARTFDASLTVLHVVENTAARGY